MESDRKWIVLSYIVAALLVSWVLDQAATASLAYLHISNPRVLGLQTVHFSTVVAFGAVGAFAYFYTRQPHVDAFATEVMQELRKVTWPPRRNAYLSTMVVVACVVVAAVILGIFDWLCATMIGKVL